MKSYLRLMPLTLIALLLSVGVGYLIYRGIGESPLQPESGAAPVVVVDIGPTEMLVSRVMRGVASASLAGRRH